MSVIDRIQQSKKREEIQMHVTFWGGMIIMFCSPYWPGTIFGFTTCAWIVYKESKIIT